MTRTINILLSIPIIYSAFMLVKSPSISDAIIVASFCGLGGFMGYVNNRYNSTSASPEIDQLEKELNIERLKSTIDNLKSTHIREKALRDSRNASLEGFANKDFKF